MKRELKQLLKKHIEIVKQLYPEVYISVKMVGDDILVSIDSWEISDTEEYIDLMYDFDKECESKGIFNIWWGVLSSINADNLTLLGNLNKKSKKENRVAV
jgi:hypothetical protein